MQKKKQIDSTSLYDTIKPSSKYTYAVKEDETIKLDAEQATTILVKLIEFAEQSGRAWGSLSKIKQRTIELEKIYLDKEQALKKEYDTKQRSEQGKIGNLVTRQKQEQKKLDEIQQKYSAIRKQYNSTQDDIIAFKQELDKLKEIVPCIEDYTIAQLKAAYQTLEKSKDKAAAPVKTTLKKTTSKTSKAKK